MEQHFLSNGWLIREPNKNKGYTICLLLFTSAPSRSMTSIKATLLRLCKLASSLSTLESKILAFEQGAWKQLPTKPCWTWQISHRPSVCHQRHSLVPTCPNQWSTVVGFTSGSPRALLLHSFCASQQIEGQEASHHEPTRESLLLSYLQVLLLAPDDDLVNQVNKWKQNAYIRKEKFPYFFLYQELLK